MNELTRQVLEALGAPFPDDEVEFLPRGSSSGKARALAYIDARSVMRRLDAVVGPGNWSFDFDVLHPDGKMVKGKLTVLGVTKCDAGESGDEDEPLKSAVSDALKRCAVHFNIGRYLYYLPAVWVAYDSQRRRFTEQPRLSPASVEHALAICGVGCSPAKPADRRPAPAPGPGQPESRGDRAAQKAVRAAETAGSYTGATGVQAQAPTPAPPRETPGQPALPEAGPATLTNHCSREGCRKPLTARQIEISQQNFGLVLCPACQKTATPLRSQQR